LKNNIAVAKSWAGPEARFMAVVKADAYGHGAVPVSRVAEAEGVDFLGVAFLEEAQELQRAGIRAPIVILYPEEDGRSAEAVRHGFYITVTDHNQLKRIKQLNGGNGGPVGYFLKVESGMHRYGMDAADIISVLDERQTYQDEQLLGVTTNLADPLMSSANLAQRQVDNFTAVMQTIKKFSQNGLYYSIDSSGSVWRNRQPAGTLVRIGHLLYGLVPGGMKADELKSVMSVKSQIAEIHTLRPGDGVGYGFSFVASRHSRVGTIPMGYADGYPWSLSNRGHVLVRGKWAPIVGRICMDAFMVDLTEILDAAAGDEVVVMGDMGGEKIDAHQLGQWAGSFSYEILSGWSKRLPRIYIDRQN
jgi:alanine racemase